MWIMPSFISQLSGQIIRRYAIESLGRKSVRGRLSREEISAYWLDRFFLQDASESDFKTMSAAVDPIRKLVIWNYKTVNGNRSVLIYNFKTQRTGRIYSVTPIYCQTKGNLNLLFVGVGIGLLLSYLWKYAKNH